MERDYLQDHVVIKWGRMGFKLKEGRFRLDIGKQFPMWGWWGTKTGCPEKLWMPHPWKCSNHVWMGLWATWSSWRCPCPWQAGWNHMMLKVPPNSSHSMNLWLKTIKTLRTSNLIKHLPVLQNDNSENILFQTIVEIVHHIKDF